MRAHNSLTVLQTLHCQITGESSRLHRNTLHFLLLCFRCLLYGSPGIAARGRWRHVPTGHLVGVEVSAGAGAGVGVMFVFVPMLMQVLVLVLVHLCNSAGVCVCPDVDTNVGIYVGFGV